MSKRELPDWKLLCGKKKQDNENGNLDTNC